MVERKKKEVVCSGHYALLSICLSYFYSRAGYCMESELPKGSVAVHFCRLLRVDLMLVYQRKLDLVHVITMLLLTEV